MHRKVIDTMPPIFLRCEPAASKVPFVRCQEPTVIEGSGAAESQDLNTELGQITYEIQSSWVQHGRRFPLRTDKHNPKDGDIVGYLDEGCTRPLFRNYWWQLNPSDRRKLQRLSFMWVGYWDPDTERRRIVWLPPLESSADV
jgi:hypothetical protein